MHHYLISKNVTCMLFHNENVAYIHWGSGEHKETIVLWLFVQIWQHRMLLGIRSEELRGLPFTMVVELGGESCMCVAHTREGH